jgi:hypothetical protein
MAAPPHVANDDGYFREGWTGWLYVTWMPSCFPKNYGLDLNCRSHVGRVPRPDGSWTTPFTVSLGRFLFGAVLT